MDKHRGCHLQFLEKGLFRKKFELARSAGEKVSVYIIHKYYTYYIYIYYNNLAKIEYRISKKFSNLYLLPLNV